MGKTAQIAISLPEEVLDAVEMERQAKGESRSEFFRRAVETRLKQERESSAIRDYVRGYQQNPDSDEEVEAAHRIGSAVLAAEPGSETRRDMVGGTGRACRKASCAASVLQ